jgi:hypothetical protein
MAFIYTKLNTNWVNNPGLEPLVARVYANGVDIYPATLNGGVFTPPHKLRGCTKFQWEFDQERDGTYVKIDGATTDTYQVPEDSVNNSGDYRCIITIGESDGECGSTITDVRTVAIIDCGNMTPIYFNGNGGAGSRSITPVFPHFITQNELSVTPPSWITSPALTCTLVSGNCTGTLSLVAQSVTTGGRANTPRNGYIDIQIGDFFCSYPVQQNYIRTQEGDDPTDDDDDPPVGPTLSLYAPNGGQVITNGSLIVTATSTVIGTNGQLTTDSGFSWADPTGDVSSFEQLATVDGVSKQEALVDTTTTGPKTLTFAVTVGDFTVTKNITITVADISFSTQTGVVTGEQVGVVQARSSNGYSWGAGGPTAYYERNKATAQGTFVVESGLAEIDVTISDGRALYQFRPFNGKATMRFNITGPGINGGTFSQDVSVTPAPVGLNPSNPYYIDPPTTESINPSVITGRTDGKLVPGEYSWELDLHRVAGEEGDGSIASGSPYGDGTGVVVKQQSPYQEAIFGPPPGSEHWLMTQLYNPKGTMIIGPVFNFTSS